MIATFLGYLSLLAGLLIVLLPLLLIELSRPKDILMGFLLLIIGLVLLTNNDRFIGSPMIAVFSCSLLIGKLVLEITQSRWNQLSLEERVALRSLKRFNRSLSELSATFNYLGVNFLELFKISDAKVKKHGKKWIRSEMDLKETSSKDVASVSDSLQNIKENP